MQFVKMHGLGNDFVVVRARRVLPGAEELARRVCDRHFGIGADGLVFVLPSEKADLRMRIFNPDGSEAEMCGNAIRCVAKYVYENGLHRKTELRVETGAGIIVPRLRVSGEEVTEVEVDMGEPILEREMIPVAGPPGRVLSEPLLVDDEVFRITAVSFGNPHCVIFLPDVTSLKLDVIGPKIENHPAFPKRTNVEFVQVLSTKAIRVRVWERGAGQTLACGTGACASVVAAFLNGLTERKVKVSLPGGDLLIFWDEKNHVYMTGPATEVFRGEWAQAKTEEESFTTNDCRH